MAKNKGFSYQSNARSSDQSFFEELQKIREELDGMRSASTHTTVETESWSDRIEYAKMFVGGKLSQAAAALGKGFTALSLLTHLFYGLLAIAGFVVTALFSGTVLVKVAHHVYKLVARKPETITAEEHAPIRSTLSEWYKLVVEWLTRPMPAPAGNTTAQDGEPVDGEAGGVAEIQIDG